MRHVAVVHPNGGSAWVCSFPDTASEPMTPPHDQMIYALGQRVSQLEQELAEAKLDAGRFRKYLKLYDTEEMTAAEWGGPDAITAFLDADGCICHRCIEENDIRLDGMPLSHTMIINCPVCGNKRCPKASDHRNACTHSNEPGQAGSIYGGME
jgi:hypothetical protein